MATQTKLKTRDVRKTYGSVIALHGTSIDLAEGEFLTLLGPSGSGKTTLLMAIAGLNDPDSGEIWIDDNLITYAPPHQRGLGMVFQNYALFPHLSVYENIAFPLRMRKESETVIDEKVHKVLNTVELPGVGDRLPSELSGGQQQRIALARCFVYEPSIILMDEPLGALDKKLRDSLQREIKHLHEGLGITVLYVTHDQEEAMVMSDRICLMNGGRIEQIGSPHDLYFRPQSIFAADFLGESNLLAASVQSSDADNVVLERPDGGKIVGVPGTPLVTGQSARFMVRPENLSLTANPDYENNATGTLKEIIMIGQITKYFMELPDGTEMVATMLTDRGVPVVESGATITFYWAKQDTRVFADSDSMPAI
ncbi:MAG: putative spermidine/putrescine transport system ATP-binding protein [Parasphingorhabdus sp.]|jgi:putative spermidine/putrescine transport system ATP-binding protein